MRIITISGAHSGVGKTLVAEMLLNALKGWSALKVTVLHSGACPTGRSCGACDYLDNPKFSITGEGDIGLEERGKDTERLKRAGARDVLWLRASPEGLERGLKKAISIFKGAKGLIVESTSALKYIKPNFAIFVKKRDSVLKPSARQIIKKVDLIITV